MPADRSRGAAVKIGVTVDTAARNAMDCSIRIRARRRGLDRGRASDRQSAIGRDRRQLPRGIHVRGRLRRTGDAHDPAAQLRDAIGRARTRQLANSEPAKGTDRRQGHHARHARPDELHRIRTVGPSARPSGQIRTIRTCRIASISASSSIIEWTGCSSASPCSDGSRESGRSSSVAASRTHLAARSACSWPRSIRTISSVSGGASRERGRTSTSCSVSTACCVRDPSTLKPRCWSGESRGAIVSAGSGKSNGFLETTDKNGQKLADGVRQARGAAAHRNCGCDCEKRARRKPSGRGGVRRIRGVDYAPDRGLQRDAGAVRRTPEGNDATGATGRATSQPRNRDRSSGFRVVRRERPPGRVQRRLSRDLCDDRRPDPSRRRLRSPAARAGSNAASILEARGIDEALVATTG